MSAVKSLIALLLAVLLGGVSPTGGLRAPDGGFTGCDRVSILHIPTANLISVGDPAVIGRLTGDVLPEAAFDQAALSACPEERDDALQSGRYDYAVYFITGENPDATLYVGKDVIRVENRLLPSDAMTFYLLEGLYRCVVEERDYEFVQLS